MPARPPDPAAGPLACLADPCLLPLLLFLLPPSPLSYPAAARLPLLLSGDGGMCPAGPGERRGAGWAGPWGGWVGGFPLPPVGADVDGKSGMAFSSVNSGQVGLRSFVARKLKLVPKHALLLPFPAREEGGVVTSRAAAGFL